MKGKTKQLKELYTLYHRTIKLFFNLMLLYGFSRNEQDPSDTDVTVCH